MVDLRKYYRGTAVNESGTEFNLVDTNELTGLFDDLKQEVQFGKKTKTTSAYIAKQGEEIITINSGNEENRYTAKGGEVVFDNGGGDKFVPRDDDGKSNGKLLLQGKYEILKGSLENGDAVYIPKGGVPSKVLTNIPDNVRIMNPWGQGSTQDLPAGSTLKLDGDKVTGIEGEAFKNTWSLTDKAGKIVQNASVKQDAGPKKLEQSVRIGENVSIMSANLSSENIPIESFKDFRMSFYLKFPPLETDIRESVGKKIKKIFPVLNYSTFGGDQSILPFSASEKIIPGISQHLVEMFHEGGLSVGTMGSSQEVDYIGRPPQLLESPEPENLQHSLKSFDAFSKIIEGTVNKVIGKAKVSEIPKGPAEVS